MNPPFSTLIQASNAMRVPEICGIVGGKHMPFPSDEYFALPPAMDGRPCLSSIPSRSLFPCDGTGGIDIRRLLHSLEPNCTVVVSQLAGGVLSLATLVVSKEIKAGDLITINHDEVFGLCCCGRCSKSECECCHTRAVLHPCPHCRMTYYCSDDCRAAAFSDHAGVCEARCDHTVSRGPQVLSQVL